MTLYLVKLDPATKDRNGEPKFQAIIGRCIDVAGKGYRFLPATSAHKGSRKLWPSAVSSIPAWTERCGFLRLYDKAELDAAQAA